MRRTLADERNVPAYVIFSDVALREMARSYPTTPAEFRRIPGVGEQKLKDFAGAFLAAISDYLKTNPRLDFAPAFAPPPPPSRRRALSESEAETVRRLRTGESIDEIARARGFVRNTILSHLALAVEAGAPLTAEELFTSEQRQEMGSAFARAGTRGLTGIRDLLGGKYEVGELRIFRALTSAPSGKQR